MATDSTADRNDSPAPVMQSDMHLHICSTASQNLLSLFACSRVAEVWIAGFRAPSVDGSAAHDARTKLPIALLTTWCSWCDMLCRIPAALPGRTGVEREIFGMAGVPAGAKPGKPWGDGAWAAAAAAACTRVCKVERWLLGHVNAAAGIS